MIKQIARAERLIHNRIVSYYNVGVTVTIELLPEQLNLYFASGGKEGRNASFEGCVCRVIMYPIYATSDYSTDASIWHVSTPDVFFQTNYVILDFAFEDINEPPLDDIIINIVRYFNDTKTMD